MILQRNLPGKQALPGAANGRGRARRSTRAANRRMGWLGSDLHGHERAFRRILPPPARAERRALPRPALALDTDHRSSV
jgi:hypothetical protein